MIAARTSISIEAILCSFETPDTVVRLPRFELDALATTPDDEIVAKVFRLLNHVMPGDAQRMPTGGRHRSLSAGDVVILGSEAPRRIFLLTPLGIRLLTTDELFAWTSITNPLDRIAHPWMRP